MRQYNFLYILFLTIFSLSAQNEGARAILCPPVSPVATLCNLNIINQLCVGGNEFIAGDLTVSGIIVGEGNVFFGNTLRVDIINGNDAIGNRNGAPFQTINAALAQALPGDVVWVFPGTYNEILTIPAGVILSGIVYNSTVVQQLGVTTPTDLVTVGAGSTVNNISFRVTAAADVPIRGMVLTGNTTGASTALSNGQIVIDTTAAGLTTSNVYGIYYSTAGNPVFIDAGLLFSTVVITASTGVVRGILLDKSGQFDVINAQIQAIGLGNAIGVETNDPNALLQSVSSLFSGSTADISQTSGTLAVTAVNFANSEANGLGFNTIIKPATFIFADSDYPVGANDTLYLRPGTAAASNIPITIPASQKFLAKSITARAIIPPGPGESTIFIVQKNGIDTPLAVTLLDNDLEETENNISVHFSPDDLLSIKMVTSLAANTSDVLVSVNIY